MWWLVITLIAGCVNAQDFDIKSVKGGYGSNFNYHGGDSLAKFYRNDSEHYGMRHNLTDTRNYETGVCYIEVPTASLVRGSDIPAGNGSRPDLSRIRSCCKGYIRNIHNFRICDPVCTLECVNALCTAPEVCTCFPDHIKNLAGFCVSTCPIGCQNGQCNGHECICKDGFKLDQSRQFCVPSCQENCGGIGNCTAPNTCECKSGYQSTPEGACKPVCHDCVNGDCIAPNECRCRQGYAIDRQHGDGKCVPQCNPACGPNIKCLAPNRCDTPSVPPRSQISSIYPQLPQNGDYYQNSQVINPNQPNQYPPQTYNQVHPQYPQPVQPQGGSGYYSNQAPECSQPCINGVCVEGNRCSCNPGYINDQSDPSGFKCIPHCPGGCPNGVCSAPNFCICNMGYFKDRSVKGRPSCVKRVRRSADNTEIKKPENIIELLMFEIPDY